MWGLPLFDLDEPDGVLAEINACRATFPDHYIRVLAYDAPLGRQTTALQFLVQRPADEPGFLLTRTEGQDRADLRRARVRHATGPFGARPMPPDLMTSP